MQYQIQQTWRIIVEELFGHCGSVRWWDCWACWSTTAIAKISPLAFQDQFRKQHFSERGREVRYTYVERNVCFRHPLWASQLVRNSDGIHYCHGIGHAALLQEDSSCNCTTRGRAVTLKFWTPLISYGIILRATDFASKSARCSTKTLIHAVRLKIMPNEDGVLVATLLSIVRLAFSYIVQETWYIVFLGI